MTSVSVIIPAHNSASTLENAVVSALGQTRPPSEIIIVENGSSDQTLSIAEHLADIHPSVKVIQSKTGVSNARNLGIKTAASDYIAFLDADDTYYPDALYTLGYFLDRHSVDFVKGNLVHDFKNVTRIWRPSLRAYNAPRNIEMEPDYCDFVAIYCGLYRRSFLSRFDTPFPIDVHTAEDRVFVWDTLLSGSTFIHIDKVVYLYNRTSETSVLRKVDGAHFDLFKAYAEILRRNNILESPEIEYKFWLQYVSMMEFSYFADGRLTEEGKKRWMNECRKALKPIAKGPIVKRIMAGNSSRRCSFVASLL